MSDIFISYARADRRRAEALAKLLEAQGWSVWWDRVIPTGKKFRQVIEAEINAANCVVVLWSAASIQSDWVIEEASEANERGILLPVLIDKVRQPIGFRSIHAADLIGWEGDLRDPQFQRLRGDIANFIVGAAGANARPNALRRPGEQQIGASDGLRYVWIPPGEFWMGAKPGDTDAAPSEKPRHQVRITQGFWLSDTPVTVAAYRRFLKERPACKMPDAQIFNPDWNFEDHPIVNVTWDEAQAYCAWAGGPGGRLPTEAHWEYAARGGKDGQTYPWGDDITPQHASYLRSGCIPAEGTMPVGSYAANEWGLHDMAGNVWEWVADWYDKDYFSTLPPDKLADDPRGPDSGTHRVMRGGSFYDEPTRLRASVRDARPPNERSYGVGFRCVRDVVL